MFLNNVHRINFPRERPGEQTNENIINFHASRTKSRILCAARNQNKFRPCNSVRAQPRSLAPRTVARNNSTRRADLASRLIALNATRSFPSWFHPGFSANFTLELCTVNVRNFAPFGNRFIPIVKYRRPCFVEDHYNFRSHVGTCSLSLFLSLSLRVSVILLAKRFFNWSE